MNKPQKDRSFVEAIAEGVEASMDLIIDNEAFKAIPFVGTMVKIAKGVDDYRSKLLLQKIYAFLSEPNLLNRRESTEMRELILGDPEQQKNIGDTLFLVLDKVTDFQKPILLAKVFAAYLGSAIDARTFLMLAHCIDQNHLADLLALASPNDHASTDAEWQSRLVSSGLTTSQVVNADITSYLVYDTSALGLQFIRSVNPADSSSTEG